jgi:hypothetical protein
MGSGLIAPQKPPGRRSTRKKQTGSLKRSGCFAAPSSILERQSSKDTAGNHSACRASDAMASSEWMKFFPPHHLIRSFETPLRGSSG